MVSAQNSTVLRLRREVMVRCLMVAARGDGKDRQRRAEARKGREAGKVGGGIDQPPRGLLGFSSPAWDTGVPR